MFSVVLILIKKKASKKQTKACGGWGPTVPAPFSARETRSSFWRLSCSSGAVNQDQSEGGVGEDPFPPPPHSSGSAWERFPC